MKTENKLHIDKKGKCKFRYMGVSKRFVEIIQLKQKYYYAIKWVTTKEKHFWIVKVVFT